MKSMATGSDIVITRRGLTVISIGIAALVAIASWRDQDRMEARGAGAAEQRLQAVESSLSDGIVRGREVELRLGRLEERMINVNASLMRELSQVREDIKEARLGIRRLLDSGT